MLWRADLLKNTQRRGASLRPPVIGMCERGVLGRIDPARADRSLIHFVGLACGMRTGLDIDLQPVSEFFQSLASHFILIKLDETMTSKRCPFCEGWLKFAEPRKSHFLNVKKGTGMS